MAAIDGLIILDSTGRAIISSHFRGHSASYPLLHIDAFNQALARSKPHYATPSGSRAASSVTTSVGAVAHTVKDELDPVIWVTVPIRSQDVDRVMKRAAVKRGKKRQLGMGYGEASDDSSASESDEEEGDEEMSGYGQEADVYAGDGQEIGGGWQTVGLCHVEKEGMRFLAPLSHEINPLFAFSFLECFIGVLEAYFGEVTENTIRDNFEIVYMLIEEMLDEGHPMTTEPNMLKDIVLPPTLVRKLLTAAGVSGALNQTTNPFVTPIPWRRPNVRYSNNEIYFDIEESMDALVDRLIIGIGDSGNPDLLLTFANPKTMENCSFHPCVRYKKWNKDHVLSFIPPDGHFDLLEYEAVPSVRSTALAANNKSFGLPLVFKPELRLDDTGGKFTLNLSSRVTTRPIENIIISIYLGENVNHVSATPSGDSRGIGNGNTGSTVLGCVGGGTWEFDPNRKILKWLISSLTSIEKSASLVGSFSTRYVPLMELEQSLHQRSSLVFR
ncbi:hypothetical protein QFC22_003219 [Naganishia vaughanmartiniae]|uniref:Uncharacterized protein n=1 Tax=Naganishia vaughanmartiniae TaxID=1424756 RepID=A0ACC2X760_9TREE|nr:hypothetical protein QFC22_003219 [Naganishia vaughanmartiniae]